MWVDIDDVRAELERLVRKGEEELVEEELVEDEDGNSSI